MFFILFACSVHASESYYLAELQSIIFHLFIPFMMFMDWRMLILVAYVVFSPHSCLVALHFQPP